MDDISLDIACPQPARRPEAVASGLIGDDDALDLAPLLAGWRSKPGTTAATSQFDWLISIATSSRAVG
jgi:hypothetical protein